MLFDDPSAHDSDFGSEILVAEQEFDEAAAIAEVSSEEFDLGFGEINYDTDDSCYVATVDGLVNIVDDFDITST